RRSPCHRTRPTPRTKLGETINDRQKVIAGKLAGLARKANRAVGQQDLGLADAARMEQDLARRRIARRVLIAEPEIERTQWNPACLAAPPDMDQALAVGQHRLEPRTGLRRGGALEPCGKGEPPDADVDIGHAGGSLSP